jgi:hypothetical protein
MAGASHTMSGHDHVRIGNALSAKMSVVEAITATMMVASTGSVTRASAGMPRIANPPPNAPLPNPMMKTAGTPTR